MKKLFLALFFLFGVLSIYAQKAEKLIVGTWKVSMIEGKTPNGPDASLQFIFNKDGSFKAILLGREEPGTWKLSPDGKTLSVTITREAETGDMKVVQLDKKVMKLDREGAIAEFVKEGKNATTKKPKPVKLKGIAKDVVGTWQVVKLSDADMPKDLPKMVVQFNADGTVWATGMGAGGDEARWKISDDGKQLVMIESDREDPADFTLSADKKNLDIIDGSTKIQLTRIKEKISKPEPRSEEPWTEPVTPDEVEPIPNATVAKENQVIGTWKVVSMDSDKMEDRTLVFKVNADKSFSVEDNGNTERKGTWEFKDGRLIISESGSYANDFRAYIDEDNQLILTDYYGTMTLKKQ